MQWRLFHLSNSILEDVKALSNILWMCRGRLHKWHQLTAEIENQTCFFRDPMKNESKTPNWIPCSLEKKESTICCVSAGVIMPVLLLVPGWALIGLHFFNSGLPPSNFKIAEFVTTCRHKFRYLEKFIL